MDTEDRLQIVVRRRTGPSGVCSILTGVPAAASTLIDVFAAPTDAAEAAADELVRAIVASLRKASPGLTERTGPCEGIAATREGCPPEWHRVMVLVADVGAPSFEAVPAVVIDAWLATPTGFAILPLLQLGLVAERYLTTPRLRAVNASWWSSSPAENVDEVLALADLGAEERRVFVSYRRLETLNVAEQLFEVLEKHRFDVFVDRFRVPPGRDFQERLTDELVHKSMVLVLESPTILESEWIAHELSFAKDHGLGHLAVHLPGGVRVPWLDDDYRVLVAASELDPPSTGSSSIRSDHRLGELALTRIVDRLVAEHSTALLRRRGVMLDELRYALARHTNVSQRLDSRGHLHVAARFHGWAGDDAPHARGVPREREYILWITPRPPEIDSFRTAHGFCDPGPDPTGAIVTSATFRSPRRRDQVAWLADRSCVRLYEDTSVTELAARIARGEDLA